MLVEDLLKKKVNENDLVIIPKSLKYDSVLVWLHGEGDTAESFSEMFMQGTLKGGLMGNTKVVIPTS